MGSVGQCRSPSVKAGLRAWGAWEAEGCRRLTPGLTPPYPTRLHPAPPACAGLLDTYDAPLSLAAIAPRPLLVANGELDPRCPLEGLRLAVDAARPAYAAAGAPENLQLFVDPGVGHECTEAMWREVDAWMDKHLLLGQPPSG